MLEDAAFARAARGARHSPYWESCSPMAVAPMRWRASAVPRTCRGQSSFKPHVECVVLRIDVTGEVAGSPDRRTAGPPSRSRPPSITRHPPPRHSAPIDRRMCGGNGEVTHLANHGGQIRLINQKRLAGEKRSPLLHLFGILREGIRQRRRAFTWNRRGTPLERGMNRGGKHGSFKLEESRHREKIVEILHPTVREVQRHDRLELFRNDGFAWIGVEPGCGLIQQNRIRQLQGTGSHRVAKTDVDLDRDDGRRKTRRRTQPKPPIYPVVANRFRHQVLRIEDQSILLDRLYADFAEYRHKTLGCPLTDGKKVQVSGRSKRIFEPGRVEHGALEDEAFLVRRLAQSEENPFQRISRQHTLEICPVLPGDVLETSTHRRCNAPHFTRHRRPPLRDRASGPTRSGCRGRTERSPPVWPCWIS